MGQRAVSENTMSKFLIYGANGYTGELITRFAVERGLSPVIAGRNAAAIDALAERYSLDHRVFSLDDAAAVDSALAEVDVVLHCAGPFSITSRPMVEACIRNGKHYTDITGEIAVFEACAVMGKKAEAAGVMTMPGVGFDVVPSDCLAVHLRDRLPDATHLTLAWYSKGRMSHGTQATMTMNVGKGGAIRKDGKITPVPAAWKTRDFDFDGVVKTGVTIPWGDVSTAYHSTGIPNIEVYTVVPPEAMRLMKVTRYLGWLMATRPVQRYLQANIPPGGPSDSERQRGQVLLWGEAVNGEGKRVSSRISVPDGYTVTALAALNIVEKIVAGDYTPGFQTPAKAYGADLILEIDTARREDIS